MFKHHLIIAIRNIARHRSSFLINLLGLSTGLTCAMLIFLWVHDEMSMDKFHVNDHQLYQVMETSVENDKILVNPHTQGLLADAMAKDLPEVESAVCFVSLVNEGFEVTLKTQENKIIKSGGVFATEDFFKMFSYDLIQGQPLQVLQNKNAIVVSRSLATSLFGKDVNPVGKIIEWEAVGLKSSTQVSGVFDDVPAQSTQKFDFVLSRASLLELLPQFKEWYNEGTNTFIQLKAGTDVTAFNKKIKDFIRTHHKDNMFSLFVRPYSSTYLYGKYENGVQAGGRIGYVRLFSLIAFFILIIACINFMNLSTAKASRRQKEVGIKKAVGSSRGSLITQFLTEAVLVSLFSLFVACGIVYILLPQFNHLTGKSLHIDFELSSVLLMIGATIVTGLISGSYPALYLSGFNVVAIIKGKIKNSFGEIFARQGLVVFQFVVSLLLIIAVMVVYRQMKLIQTMNLGYDKANVVYFDKEGNINTNTSSFLTQLRNIPGVLKASTINGGIAQSTDPATTYGIDWPGKPANDVTNFSVRSVDLDLIETLGIQIKEGRSFSKEFGDEETKLIFNETAINAMALKDPIGKQVKMWGKDMTIVGITKDFNVKSIHEAIPPLVFKYSPKDGLVVMAKIAAGKEKETLAQMEALYKQVNPGYDFKYSFLDERYQTLYQAEKRVSALARYFAGLAIIISCLGLFGLAAFNAEVRAKEIGIRKVLGAGIANVVYLLSKDFMKLALIAVVIAFPFGWWAMNEWLSGFVTRVKMDPSVFIFAFVIISGITLLTVGFQGVKAAIVNPIRSLRTE
ncbi:MAG: ABC transporter permease [Saprospiraceae bacterium]